MEEESGCSKQERKADLWTGPGFHNDLIQFSPFLGDEPFGWGTRGRKKRLVTVPASRRRDLLILAALDMVVVLLFVPSFLFAILSPPSGFTSSAQVSASVLSCNSASVTCTVSLTNTGAADGSAIGCSLTSNGVTERGVISGKGIVDIPAGSRVNATCTGSSGFPSNPQSGSQAIGQFTLSNGGTVMFSGEWS